MCLEYLVSYSIARLRILKSLLPKKLTRQQSWCCRFLDYYKIIWPLKFVLSWITKTSRFKTLLGCTRTQTHGCHYTSTNWQWFTASDTVNIIRSVARFRPEHSHTRFHISYTSSVILKLCNDLQSPTPTEPSPDYRPHLPNAAIPSQRRLTITLPSPQPPATLSNTLLYLALIFLHLQKMTALQRL